MKTTLKALILTLIFLGITNCYSSNFFSLFPDEETSSVELGRETVVMEDEMVYSSLAFEEQADNHFVFYLYIHNKNQNEIKIDPKNIYTKVFNENKKRLRMNRNKITAVDPEREIENINNEVIEREETHDINTGLNIAYSILNTFVDLTDDEDNDAEEVAENVLIFTGNQIGEEVSYDNDIDYLKSKKDFWQNETLRKSRLSKNDEVGGLIFIPINNDAKYIKIFIPLGESMHTYKFKQVAID